MTQFTCKGVKQINNWISFKHLYHSYLSAFFISAGVPNGEFPEILIAKCRSRFYFTWFFCWGDIVQEINVSRAWDPVHAGDKALTRETPAKRGGVNRYVKGRKNLEIVEMKPNIKNLNDIQREIRKAYWKYIDNSLTTRQWPNEWKTKLYEKILDFYKTQKIRWKTNTTS